MIHPDTVFSSLSWPSVHSFLIDIMSFLGFTSRSERGREIKRIAKGIARTTRVGASPISGAIPMELSMYMSTFPLSMEGIAMDNSLAW